MALNIYQGWLLKIPKTLIKYSYFPRKLRKEIQMYFRTIKKNEHNVAEERYLLMEENGLWKRTKALENDKAHFVLSRDATTINDFLV